MSDEIAVNHSVEQLSAITQDIQFGGFWRRFAAIIIDFLLMLLPILLVTGLLRVSVLLITEVDLHILQIMDNLTSIVMWWLYFALFNSSSWQASLGKRAMGLKVIDLQGQRISFARASGRFFAEYLSALTLCIGYMMAGWTKRKRSLHDMIAKTYVIKS